MDLASLSKDATQHTKECNHHFAEHLNFSDKQDFEDVQRGFVARFEGDAVYGDNQDFPVWALDA